jgi:hypothetical protein
VRPHLSQSWYVLPAAGLAALPEQVPVAAARWRLGRDDPAELLGAIRGCLAGRMHRPGRAVDGAVNCR